MNYNNACKILKIKTPFTNDELKKKYRKMVLKYHPDKTNYDSSNEFQKIHEAYLFLQTNDEQVENTLSFMYQYSKQIYFSILEHLPEDTLIKLYDFLQKQEKLLSSSMKRHVLDIIKSKQPIVEINPSLSNLLNSEVYLLDIQGDNYYVPLWHDELIFKNKFKVLCKPELPEHIMIDSNNNILVFINIKNKEKRSFAITLGDKKFNVALNDSHIENKKYIFYKCGIPRIHCADIYNVSEKGDIICKLSFNE